MSSPTRYYEFRVTGRLSERAQHAVDEFGDVSVVPAPPETIIYGNVIDPARLHGLLALFQDLGIEVVSMRRGPRRAELSSGSPPHAEQ